MKLNLNLKKLRHNNYFANIYIIIFILSSLLLLLFSFFVFLFDFNSSSFGIDITFNGRTSAIGLYLITTFEGGGNSELLYTLGLSHFGIFSLSCFSIITILFAGYYPIFKNRIILINMFYIFIANLLSLTLLFACFPLPALVDIIVHDISGVEPDEIIGQNYIFTTILLTNQSIIFSHDSNIIDLDFMVSLNSSVTWFYIIKHIIYALICFVVFLSDFIIVKELFSNKKFFLDSNIKQIIAFNNG